MRIRKDIKQRARQVLRTHYWVFFIVCLAASFLGTEFSSSLDFIKSRQPGYVAETEDNGSTVSTGPTTGRYEVSPLEAILLAVSGDVESGKQIAGEITAEAVEKTKSGEGSSVFGRSRGVLAGLVNSIDSGSIIVNIISAVRNIGVSTNAVLIIFILAALLLLAGVWFFLINMFKVVSRRVFLEGRIYKRVSAQRMLFLIRVKKWVKVSFTMFMTSLLYWLWSLTLVGAVIKRYSYIMVPYIVAENPNIGWKQAITLSRKMMDGHKWEYFIYEVTFLPWAVLSLLTLGVSDLFYVNMYKTATFAEYYADLRNLAKNNSIEGSELLDDKYLFGYADEKTLKKAYADIIAMEKEPLLEPELKGVRGFLAKVFGITILRRADEEAFEASEERKAKVSAMRAALEGREYPKKLCPYPVSDRHKKREGTHYLRHYSIWSLILLFFIFSLIGWLWEVSLHLVSDGVFVNRGVLHGPWLPIYGTGGILILTVLNWFRKNPMIEFFATVVLCGCVEYFTAYFLEVTHDGQKWWDYSGYFLNLHGRICAEGLLIFGIGGMAIVYFAAPLLDNHLRKIKYAFVVPLCIVLLLIFAGDQIYSRKHPNTGKGITDYKGALLEEPDNKEESTYFL